MQASDTENGEMTLGAGHIDSGKRADGQGGPFKGKRSVTCRCLAMDALDRAWSPRFFLLHRPGLSVSPGLPETPSHVSRPRSWFLVSPAPCLTLLCADAALDLGARSEPRPGPALERPWSVVRDGDIIK